MASSYSGKFQCPHCDSIFPDIGSVKIHNAHKEVRHKYAEVNKNDAANNFKLLSTDIAQTWLGFNGPNRTTVRSSRHGASVDQVRDRDRSLLRSIRDANIAQNFQGDRHGDANIAQNCQGDRHSDRNHGHGIDKFKVINFWIYRNYCLKIMNWIEKNLSEYIKGSFLSLSCLQ